MVQSYQGRGAANSTKQHLVSDGSASGTETRTQLHCSTEVGMKVEPVPGTVAATGLQKATMPAPMAAPMAAPIAVR